MRGTRARFLSACVTAGLLALSAGLVPAVSGAALVHPQNPGPSFQSSGNYNESCANPLVVTGTCPAGLSGLDALRAAEGVVPMSLPTNFASLTSPEQVFVLANLERVDRGLPPVQGLSATLDADAQAGAAAGGDPALPASGQSTGANWGQSANLFSTYQLWMYQDGWAGSATTNGACTSPSASGCWGHRDNILGSYASPSIMGAGVAPRGQSQISAAEVFAGGDTVDAPYFTWADVVPYLPVGVTDSAVSVSSVPGTAQTGAVELWASGEAMNVSVTINGGNGVFTMNSSACSLAVGHSCQAGINFSPPSLGEYSASLSVAGPNGVQTVPLVGVASRGYRIVGGDGGVFNFGGASFLGSTGSLRLNRPIVGMADDPKTGGYWLVATDGGVFSFGAPFFGSAGGLPLGAPIVGMAATPDGGGYWLVGADGGIFNYGDAGFYGAGRPQSTGGPVVGMAATPDGRGYWLVTSGGAIVTFGDAGFHGAAATVALNRPIVGMAATPDGGGYWLVASDGGIFNFGDAGFYGSTGAMSLNRPIVGMAATPDGGGYWLVGADGGIFNFGDAGFYGSTGAMSLNSPVVGLVVGQPGS
jgi:hypothetical protein